MSEAFWVVWNFGADGNPPTFRHPSRESAAIEAERLARMHPGKVFYVLQAIGVAEVPMIFRDFDGFGKDGIPF